MPDQEPVLGPIDLLVVEVPASGPGPRGLAALLRLAEADHIRVLDLEIVHKAADGTLALAVPDPDAMPELTPFVGCSSGLLGADDLQEAGDFVSAGRSAIVVIYENEWVVAMETALREEGARLVAAGRIPAADIEAALGDGWEKP
ncbi:DUF6325 family protein [Kribbella sp. NPDC051770]|uniref:DUF6325 family protein n=1 Tax=Kribbella sp. NPDC051770 TaxID=3155413 RepID=UPI003439631C